MKKRPESSHSEATRLPGPVYSTPDENREVTILPLKQFEIKRAEIEGLPAKAALQVICSRLSAAVQQSLADITTKAEYAYCISELERRALPFVEGWKKENLPAPTSNWPDLEYEAAKATVLLLSSKGRFEVDGRRGPGATVPVCAERLIHEMKLWAWASETWAGVSFAELKADRITDPSCIQLMYTPEGFLERALCFMDALWLRPSVPLKHQPDMRGFGDALRTEPSDRAFATILKAVHGFDPNLLLAVLAAIREDQVAKGKTGEIAVVSRNKLAAMLHREQGGHLPTGIPELESAVEQLEAEWATQSKAYAKSAFSKKFLRHTPRIFAIVPALEAGQERVIVCNSACDLTAREATHDAVRAGTPAAPEVAEIRRQLQSRGSEHLAWHQLQLIGVARPKEGNMAVTNEFLALVSERSAVGGVQVPAKYVDIDLLLLDRNRRLIAVCECKYTSVVNRSTQFLTEFDEFAPKGKHFARQLVPRVRWVRSILDRMTFPGFADSVAGWLVEGRVLTNIVPRSVLAIYQDLPGIITVGSLAAREFLAGTELPQPLRDPAE